MMSKSASADFDPALPAQRARMADFDRPRRRNCGADLAQRRFEFIDQEINHAERPIASKLG